MEKWVEKVIEGLVDMQYEALTKVVSVDMPTCRFASLRVSLRMVQGTAFNTTYVKIVVGASFTIKDYHVCDIR